MILDSLTQQDRIQKQITSFDGYVALLFFHPEIEIVNTAYQSMQFQFNSWSKPRPKRASGPTRASRRFAAYKHPGFNFKLAGCNTKLYRHYFWISSPKVSHSSISICSNRSRRVYAWKNWYSTNPSRRSQIEETKPRSYVYKNASQIR